MKTKLNLLIAGILLIAIISWSCAAPPDASKDEMAPKDTMTNSEDATMTKPHSFSLINLEGEILTLEDMAGKPVYIKFWASWCSICLAGLEDLNTLAGQENDYEVITIVSPNYGGEQSEEDFKAWFKSLNYGNIKVLLDIDGTVAKAYGVRAYPTSAFIDKDGALLKVLPGHLDKMQIQDQFK